MKLPAPRSEYRLLLDRKLTELALHAKQLCPFEGEQYELSMYFIEDGRESGAAKTRVMRSRYYAISPSHLLALMEQAGFEDVKRLDGVFF